MDPCVPALVLLSGDVLAGLHGAEIVSWKPWSSRHSACPADADLVFLPLLLVLAAASYRYLEVPAKRWMRDRLIRSIERRAAARG